MMRATEIKISAITLGLGGLVHFFEGLKAGLVSGIWAKIPILSALPFRALQVIVGGVSLVCVYLLWKGNTR